ncbi:MAG: O-methyltransferase [Bacteroidetes bacterium]|nr:O-methyltransferase [Bacteroidota bacterium]
MINFNEKIIEYCSLHSSAQSELLYELERQTHLKTTQPRMLSGFLQGRFLSFISKLIKPNLILELGTFTGYSALCLAEGLTQNGKLLTIDKNKETNLIAKSFFEKSEYKSNIILLEKDAITEINSIADNIDLVFIDADKKNYKPYFDLVLPKLNAGGIILVDNVLWDGKVIDEKHDKDTSYLIEFNRYIKTLKNINCLMLPIRDGISIISK